MLAILLSAVLLGSAQAPHARVVNPCTAPRPLGDAAGFYAIPAAHSGTKNGDYTAEIQMMSRLIDTRLSTQVGWMYVDQRGERWIQLANDAGESVHKLFNARYIPSRPNYDYQTVYPFTQRTLPSEIRLDSCEMP
ncbi:MAG TPA: hypothetical protein VIG51_11775 [Candidatus Baltobacteraceae bacterium]|jgi:hypothetical protein